VDDLTPFTISVMPVCRCARVEFLITPEQGFKERDVPAGLVAGWHSLSDPVDPG
jgi:hypothetical protein